jgi:hypothetical protein
MRHSAVDISVGTALCAQRLQMSQMLQVLSVAGVESKPQEKWN